MTLPTPTKLREGKVMGIKTQHVGYNLAIEKKIYIYIYIVVTFTNNHIMRRTVTFFFLIGNQKTIINEKIRKSTSCS